MTSTRQTQLGVHRPLAGPRECSSVRPCRTVAQTSEQAVLLAQRQLVLAIKLAGSLLLRTAALVAIRVRAGLYRTPTGRRISKCRLVTVRRNKRKPVRRNAQDAVAARTFRKIVTIDHWPRAGRRAVRTVAGGRLAGGVTPS